MINIYLLIFYKCRNKLFFHSWHNRILDACFINSIMDSMKRFQNFERLTFIIWNQITEVHSRNVILISELFPPNNLGSKFCLTSLQLFSLWMYTGNYITLRNDNWWYHSANKEKFMWNGELRNLRSHNA